MTNNVQCDTLSGDRLVSFPKCCQNLKLLSSGTKRSLFTYIQNVKRFKRGRYGNRSLESDKGWMWVCFDLWFVLIIQLISIFTKFYLAIRFLMGFLFIFILQILSFGKWKKLHNAINPQFSCLFYPYFNFSLPSLS